MKLQNIQRWLAGLAVFMLCLSIPIQTLTLSSSALSTRASTSSKKVKKLKPLQQLKKEGYTLQNVMSWMDALAIDVNSSERSEYEKNKRVIAVSAVFVANKYLYPKGIRISDGTRLILAVIHKESTFNRYEANSGTYGLTQIRESSTVNDFTQYATLKEKKGVSLADWRYGIKANIAIGTWYIARIGSLGGGYADGRNGGQPQTLRTGLYAHRLGPTAVQQGRKDYDYVNFIQNSMRKMNVSNPANILDAPLK